jgi:hypothetical protein
MSRAGVSNAGEKAAPQSELVSVVAWMQIVGSGFWALVALFMFGFALLMSWASHASAQMPRFNPWPTFGVGCFFLAGALLLLGSGLGLRHRYDWARRLTGVLCYAGIFGSITLFGLEYVALDHLMPVSPTATPEATDVIQTIRLVLEVFLGGLNLAVVALLGWVANRLKQATLIAEFQVQPAVTQPEPYVMPPDDRRE